MSVCLRRTVRVASPVAFSAVRNAMRVPVMGARSYSIPPDSQDGPIDDSFIPARLDRSHETPDVTRARLIYQSRKRGILETDLVLSTFADKYLPTMSPEELKEYDELLDEPDWEIYYWATEKIATPPEWKNSRILAILKKHVKNEGKVILRMPDLKTQ